MFTRSNMIRRHGNGLAAIRNTNIRILQPVK